jgi:hypothetical protein
MAIAAAGFVALSIFGLAGTACVWWRSRRKVIIGSVFNSNVSELRPGGSATRPAWWSSAALVFAGVPRER